MVNIKGKSIKTKLSRLVLKKPIYSLASFAVALCIVFLFVLSLKKEGISTTQKPGQITEESDQRTSEGNKPLSVPEQIPSPEIQTDSNSPFGNIERTVQTEKTSLNADALVAFDGWLENFLAANKNDRQNLLKDGVAIAELRQPFMERLLQEEPESALEHSVSYSEYEELPDEIKIYIEKPFTSKANVILLPDETGSGSGPTAFLEIINGAYRSRRLFLYGKRQNMLSKNGISTQGIIINDTAAIFDTALQVISTQEDLAWAARKLPIGNSDTTKDFLTNELIVESSVAAVAGGHIFYFANRQNVQTLNEKLTSLENQIGPDVGSQLLFLNAMADGEGTYSSVNAMLQDISVAASSWTETKKKVFLIRVDFSDMAGPPISKPDLLAQLNVEATAYIEEYSYDKTWIEGEVSDDVVRVPEVNGYYWNPDDKSDELLNDAKTAFDALGTGIDLLNYDIVGVYFAQIGYTWSGLGSIGGSNLWLQNSPVKTIAHELVHNYGLSHANFWDTGGLSVVGPGANEEYGDDFDIMGTGGVLGHPNMRGKSMLNWLTSSQWADVTSSGTYRVYRFDHMNAGASNQLALRILKDTNEYYWLGYRFNYTDNNWLKNGIYLTWEEWLIDTTPGSDDGKDDAGVIIGRTYSDNTANVHMTSIAKGGNSPDEWIDVTVNIGDFPQNNSPTVTITEPDTVTVRTPLVFNADGSDIDGDDLAYFWDFGDGIIHESVDTITHTWAVGGTYTVTVVVSDMKGGTKTDEVIVTVDDPMLIWNLRFSAPVENYFYDIAASPDQVMAVGKGSVISSIDGTNWTDQGSVDTNVYLYGIIYDGSQWVAVGQDFDFSGAFGDWVGVIYTSPDGSTWTNRHFGGPVLQDIAKNGSVNVAVGDGGTILRSVDSISWSTQTSGTSTKLRSVAFGDNTFTAVGALDNGSSVVVLTSVDGTNWTDYSNGAGLLDWQGFYNIEYLNDQFLASGWYSKIRYSLDNGTTFTTTRTTTEDIEGFAYGNGIFFAAGLDKDNSDADINLLSLDGANWYKLTTPSQEDREGAIFFNDTFITIGLYDDGPPNEWFGEVRQSDTVMDVLILDADDDGTPDDQDTCTDIDGDGFGDPGFPANTCQEDDCPVDPVKSSPGTCGCGIPDSGDADSDGYLDCVDQCNGDDASGDSDSDGNCNDIDDDDDNDGMPDQWETQYGLNPLINDAQADKDGDGWSNIEEYQKGTIPNDAGSHPSRAMPWLQLLLDDD